MGRQKTCQRCYRAQQDNSHYKRQGIAGLQTVKQGFGSLSCAKGEADANHQAGDGEDPRFAKNHSHDVGTLRTDGHADSNFPGALYHHVGNNAVESNGREKRRKETEKTGKRGHQLVLQQRVVDSRLQDPKFQVDAGIHAGIDLEFRDRKSTRLNSSHITISYAVFCLKKKKKYKSITYRTCHTGRYNIRSSTTPPTVKPTPTTLSTAPSPPHC